MQVQITNYAFSKTAKTITFNDLAAITLDSIALITDTTNNTIIYSPIDSTKGGTVSSNVLTLTYDTNTVAFNNTDKLQIFYNLSGDFDAEVVVTRPANTTAYAATDVIGDTGGSAILTFPNMGLAGRQINITEVTVVIESSSIPSGLTTLALKVYNASPTAIADNALYDLLSGDRTAFQKSIDLNIVVDEGSTLVSHTPNLNEIVKLGASSSSLFCLLQTPNAFTPTSGQVFRVRIKASLLQ